MSADKYPSIFSCQMGAIVYLAVHHLNIITAKFTNSRQNTHCKEAGKSCDPKCCHTDLCNMAETIRPSPAMFVFCLLLVNFAVMMFK